MFKQKFTNLVNNLKNKHFLSLSGNVAMQVLNTVYIATLFRYMNVSDLGAYVFFNSTLGLVEAFRTGFISTAFVRSYCGATITRANEVMGSTWIISLLITLGLVFLDLIVQLLFKTSSNPGLNTFIKWAGITFLVSPPALLATCVLQAEQQFDKLFYIRAFQLGISTIGLGALIVFKLVNLDTIIYVNITAATLTSVLALVLGWSNIKSIPKYSIDCVKELAHFGKYSVGSQIGSTLLGNTDTLIVNFFLGSAPLAVYNLSQRFVSIIQLVIGSSASTAVPDMAAAFNQNNKQELSRLLTKYIGILTWGLIPIILGTILLAEIPISLLGGGKYVGTQAANLLRITMAIAILAPFDRFTV